MCAVVCCTRFISDQYSSFTNMYDVALLELRNKVDFSAGNRWPICLPANDFCLSNSEFVTVTGWGAQSEGGSASQTLRKVNVPVMTSSACVNKMASIGRFVNPQTMMCAGGDEGEDQAWVWGSRFSNRGVGGFRGEPPVGGFSPQTDKN